MSTTGLFDLQRMVDLLRGTRDVHVGTFGDGMGPRTVLLRHDVDVEPGAARVFAEHLAAVGLRGMFFLRVRAPFYNLASAEVTEAVAAIAAAGQPIGLHWEGTAADEERLATSVAADFRLFRRCLPERIVPSPYVSLHRPGRNVLGSQLDPPLRSTYAPPFFAADGASYISDSGALFDWDALRERLSDRSWRTLQLLLHPEWWVTPGRDRADVLRGLVVRHAERRRMWLRDEIETFRYDRDAR